MIHLSPLKAFAALRTSIYYTLSDFLFTTYVCLVPIANSLIADTWFQNEFSLLVSLVSLTSLLILFEDCGGL